MHAPAGFEAVFDAEKQPIRIPLLLSAAILKFGEQAPKLGLIELPFHEKKIPFEFQFGDRKEAGTPTGMSRNKHQIAVLGPFPRPFEIVFQADRLIVFIDSEKSEIEIISREHEVVRIPPEEGNGEFRGKNQPDILKTLVAIKVVFAAVVERNNIAADLRPLGALFFKLRHFRLERVVILLFLESLSYRRNSRGNVRDLRELIDFDFGTPDLLDQGLCIKPRCDIVPRGRGELLDTRVSAMMIGHNQSIR